MCRKAADAARGVRAAAAFLVLMAVVAPQAAPAATARVGNIVMGTVLQITVVHPDAEQARALAEQCVAIAKHWDDVLTTWRPDGELAVLNAHAGDGPVEISDDLHAALTSMLRLSAETGGAFDPAVGPLVQFLREQTRDEESASADDPPPAESLRIKTALTLSDGRAELKQHAGLDAGGIGKGIALDAIENFLRESGAESWYLDFGGSSQLAYRREDDSTPWRVAVAGLETGRLRGTIDLESGSLSTSRALPAGDAAGTIVDPRTGKAVQPPILATVYAKDATAAEAWSTALVVLGSGGVRDAERAGVEAMVETAGNVEKSAHFPAVAASGAKSASPIPAAK